MADTLQALVDRFTHSLRLVTGNATASSTKSTPTISPPTRHRASTATSGGIVTAKRAPSPAPALHHDDAASTSVLAATTTTSSSRRTSPHPGAPHRRAATSASTDASTTARVGPLKYLTSSRSLHSGIAALANAPPVATDKRPELHRIDSGVGSLHAHHHHHAHAVRNVPLSPVASSDDAETRASSPTVVEDGSSPPTVPWELPESGADLDVLIRSYLAEVAGAQGEFFEDDSDDEGIGRDDDFDDDVGSLDSATRLALLPHGSAADALAEMHARQTMHATPMWVEAVGTATASSWASEEVRVGCLTPPPKEVGKRGLAKAVAAVVPDWDAHVVPYAAEMLETMRSLEARHYDPLPADEDLWVQPSLTPVHRALLVDLMVGTGHALDVSLDALALTISCIDRYLARKVVPDEPALELLGLAALLVATKYEEVAPPELHDIAAAAQHLYPPEEILAMECALVPTLHFQLHVPTLATFLPHAAASAATTMDPHDADTASRVAVVVRHLALVALADVRLATGFAPSLVAAAVVLVAMELAVGSDAVPWDVVAEAMGYEVEKVKAVARVVHRAASTPHARIDAMLCRALRALGIEDEDMEGLEEGEVEEEARIAVEAARVVASELAF